MRKFLLEILLLGVTLIIFGFSIKQLLKETPYTLKLPEGFPPPKIPEENKLTVERIKLGKMLFYDKILSLDKSISCGTCHAPSHVSNSSLQL